MTAKKHLTLYLGKEFILYVAGKVMESLTIGQLAKKAEVNIETIRYYERRGLIPKPSRRESGYRQYKQDTVTRIQFIKRVKELGILSQGDTGTPLLTARPCHHLWW